MEVKWSIKIQKFINASNYLKSLSHEQRSSSTVREGMKTDILNSPAYHHLHRFTAKGFLLQCQSFQSPLLSTPSPPPFPVSHCQLL